MNTVIPVPDGLAPVQLVSKAGKPAGEYVDFTGANPSGASRLRAAGRAQGLKGRELTRWVNARLTGNSAAAAKAAAAAMLSAAQSVGFVPTGFRLARSGRHATLNLERPTAAGARSGALAAAEERAAAAEKRARALEERLRRLEALLGGGAE